MCANRYSLPPLNVQYVLQTVIAGRVFVNRIKT